MTPRKLALANVGGVGQTSPGTGVSANMSNKGPQRRIAALERATDAHYASLSPADRLARFLTAWAAGDAVEASRLRGTCPKKTYRQTDSAYADLVVTSSDLVMAVTSDVRPILGRLQTVEFVFGQLDRLLNGHRVWAQLAYRIGWSDATRSDGHRKRSACQRFEEPQTTDPRYLRRQAVIGGRYIELADERVRESISGLAIPLAVELAAYWQAVDRFSVRRFGVSGETAVQAWCGSEFVDEWKAAIARYPDAVPSNESVRRIIDTMESGFASVSRAYAGDGKLDRAATCDGQGHGRKGPHDSLFRHRNDRHGEFHP